MTDKAEEREKIIIKALTEKKVSYPCLLCKGECLSLFDGFLITDIEKIAEDRVLRNIPIILVVCDNCGYIRQHRIESLGIPKKKKENISWQRAEFKGNKNGK